MPESTDQKALGFGLQALDRAHNVTSPEA